MHKRTACKRHFQNAALENVFQTESMTDFVKANVLGFFHINV